MRALFFNDRLGMGAWYRDWTPVQHPELGEVEVGGWSKWYGRSTPPFMLQELAHRNAMFALFHASEMPLLEWGTVGVERLAGNTFRVTAEIRNTRAIPTRLEAAELYGSGVPDVFELSGGGITPQASGVAAGDLGDELDLQLDGDPARIELPQGVPGRAGRTATWIVSGSGEATIEFRSQKGGTHRATVQVR
jgi:hypothetical protein